MGIVGLSVERLRVLRLDVNLDLPLELPVFHESVEVVDILCYSRSFIV